MCKKMCYLQASANVMVRNRTAPYCGQIRRRRLMVSLYANNVFILTMHLFW